MRWVIAIHGGAGTIRRDLPEEIQVEYLEGLRRALTVGKEILSKGGAALDAVEQAVRVMEDDPLFNAGRGAVLAADGSVELDATLMDGRDRSCGAVGAARTPKNPITLARRVMERTRHVLLVGEGADAFACEVGVEQVEPSYFVTERRRAQWEALRAEDREALARSEDGGSQGTVGAVALDALGNLAAATSTGGLTNKRPGRVGDSALVGAGTFACNRSAAVSCTGIGEAFMRHVSAHEVALRVELLGEPLAQAAAHVIQRTMRPKEGGLIAVDHRGEAALVYSSEGMYRGVADAAGRFEVRIWE